MKKNSRKYAPLRTKSLLSKTLTLFLSYTTGIFLLTAPLFYLLTKYFYAEDMIDVIQSVKSGHGLPLIDIESDIMEGMILQFILIFLVIGLSLFITVRFITPRLWRPFNDTLQNTERFNLAQSDVPHFTETNIREFSRLNRSLEKLMKKDKETFRIQKEFTENASHELQTPIAIIRSKLDLLLQENMNEKQMQLVSDLYQLTMRMGHLNRNLLLLAKIENAQYAATEEVDIATLLTETLPLYGVLSSNTSVRVNDQRSPRHTALKANSSLLECLLKNLIVNAIRHSPSGGEIGILLEDTHLTVSNLSAYGESLDAATLFLRFRPGDVKKKGNGLGLAIVKAVCDFHGWTVNYTFEDKQHKFSVFFSKSTYHS